MGCTFSKQKLEEAFDINVSCKEFPVNTWIWRPAILTDLLFGFPQPVQKNSGIILQIGHRIFLLSALKSVVY
jgi:hypothetical protein